MWLINSHVALGVSTAFGPRVTSFSVPGGENVFAELGGMGIDLPDGRTYLLRGGHRLWMAPEVPEITYEPDDGPVITVETSTGISVSQAASDAVGVEKTIDISLHGGSVVVSHTLTNRGTTPLRLAPWAITQLAVGGTAIVPLPRDLADPYGYQPNANVVLWPYTGVGDDPFRMLDRLILLDADRSTPTKVGISLDRGWLAYARDGLVFVKRAQHVAGGTYVDLNASGQCYCSAEFLELETIGQLTDLLPAESATHVESWELHRVSPTVSPEGIPDLLHLDEGINS